MTKQAGQIPEIDVSYVAELARLELDPEAVPRLQQDLESVLSYIDKLKELDVDNIEPTAHAADLSNVWRDDRAGTPFTRDDMLANAPATVDEELIRVPQVLPGEEGA